MSQYGKILDSMASVLLCILQSAILTLFLSTEKRLKIVRPIDIQDSQHLVEKLRQHTGRDVVVVIYNHKSRSGIQLCRQLSYRRYKYGYSLFRISDTVFNKFDDSEKMELGLDLLDLNEHPGFVLAVRGEQEIRGKATKLWREGVSGVLPEAIYSGLISKKFRVRFTENGDVSAITREAPESVIIEEVDLLFQKVIP